MQEYKKTFASRIKSSWAWYCLPIILALGRPRQKTHELQARHSNTLSKKERRKKSKERKGDLLPAVSQGILLPSRQSVAWHPFFPCFPDAQQLTGIGLVF
jgi:hypothetical protein